MKRCIFCDSESKPEDQRSVGMIYIECPLCGYYRISDMVLSSPLNIPQEEKTLFSGYIRNNSTPNNPLTITSNIISEIPQLINPYKDLGVEERISLIISFIAKNTKLIGHPVPLHQTYPMFYCKSEDELITFLEWMVQSGLIRWYSSAVTRSVILEKEGWLKYESYKEINLESKKVFVAMSFDKDLDEIFIKAIQPACKECGFKAIRIDLVEHNEKICDKIIAEIKESRFLIADFTGLRHGVYFEAGFAQGLGLKVIWTCKKGEEDKLHFDTRQYKHILWETAGDFKKQLIDRIKATIK